MIGENHPSAGSNKASAETVQIQTVINVVRANRYGSRLGPIKIDGAYEKRTRDAVRCFQHEHNLFSGSRVLDETGIVDRSTKEALKWWSEILP